LIYSMTGFGRHEVEANDRKLVVEMKSVNHRYCDISVKLPRKLGYFEPAIRSLIKEHIGRGKLDVFLTYEDHSETKAKLNYNRALAAEYVNVLKSMGEEFGISSQIDSLALSRMPEVIELEEQPADEEELWSLIKNAVEGACNALKETRAREGESLSADLLKKLQDMEANVDYIQQRSPEIVSAYRAKLEDKVKELLEDASVEESRIVMETTIFADKIAVDEEIVRLKSHIAATASTLKEGGSVGRKLDFIAQEMNREANTILSKSSDLSISDRAIDLKTDIEKVREQIQNIE